MQVQSQVPQGEQYALAFEQLGLDWRWNGSEPLSAYIEREHRHLLCSYDMEFLVKAIERACAKDSDMPSA